LPVRNVKPGDERLVAFNQSVVNMRVHERLGPLQLLAGNVRPVLQHTSHPLLVGRVPEEHHQITPSFHSIVVLPTSPQWTPRLVWMRSCGVYGPKT
jgi:hypothetical protein